MTLVRFPYHCCCRFFYCFVLDVVTVVVTLCILFCRFSWQISRAFKWVDHWFLNDLGTINTRTSSLREQFPNTEFFLVRIFSYSDWIRWSPYSVRIWENTDQKTIAFQRCSTANVLSVNARVSLKVVCRVQIWKKTFCQNSDKFGYCFIKITLYLCIYFVFTKNPLF